MPPSRAYRRSLRRAFGSHLEALRCDPGRFVSQEELALQARLDRTYVGQLENAEKTPSLFTLHLIATALGRPLADLLPDHEPPELSQPPESRLDGR
ncbi:helix-turn-helix domain-containing protein [Jiangella asiatica]|uniref:helix-turn-helix domain-containing protein n=1 Tax=Jiangella asiatica TaxID=2530372 RepID=UPI00193D9219|nr:helix-turn-helix transcriptional regulator [Jiangella asiatica]